jgi:alpha-L-fucosidase
MKIDHPWEECRGIGGSFGYNRNENLKDYSTSKELIKILIDKVARGGNLLLNIGPTADGRIPVIMQQRLYDMGEWLHVNGEAIYGTRAWKGAPEVTTETTVFFTQKGADVYVLCTEYPTNKLIIKTAKQPSAVSLLGFKGKINYSKSGNGISITPPNVTPVTNPSQYAWVFKIENAL